MPKQTAREFLNSEASREFRAAVERANGATPTPNPPITACVRQVRKWRRKAGSAYKHRPS